VDEVSHALAFDRSDPAWERSVEGLLKDISWDRTWEAMDGFVQRLREKAALARAAHVRTERWRPLDAEVKVQP
jgi:hypothetical protein